MHVRESSVCATATKGPTVLKKERVNPLLFPFEDPEGSFVYKVDIHLALEHLLQ